MPSCGGMRGMLLFLAFLIWLRIISQSQVSVPSSLLSLLIFCSLATTIDVKQVFSHGHLILLHVHSYLAVQSTHTLLCVGIWSLLGLVKDNESKIARSKDDIIGKKDDLPENWNMITPVM
jgi:hypothetical protein